MMQPLAKLLEEHPFLKGMDAKHLEFIAGCAMNTRFLEGEYLYREGQPVNHIYLVRYGKVALHTYAPGQGPMTVAVASEGEVVGWSGLVPPHRARFDALATETVRAIALDAICLRHKCETDPQMGYAMLTRVVQVLDHRLQATRLQLLDLYAAPA